jgi:hypothetical protein
MTFQPPPPPPGGNPPPPPPPPPGQWGPPPGGGYPNSQGSFDPKSVNQLDWAILGVGFLIFIFSFFDWYTVSVRGIGSGGESAWHGFFGWFAVFLAIVGSVLVGLELFMPQVKLPIANRLAALAAYAVATLCAILALFVYPGNVPDINGIDRGHGFGYWADLILIIAGTVLTLMRLQQTGGKLPGPLANMPNIGAKGPQGGVGGGQPGYGVGAGAAPQSQAPPAPQPPQSAPPPPPGYGTPQPPPPGYGQPPQP